MTNLIQRPLILLLCILSSTNAISQGMPETAPADPNVTVSPSLATGSTLPTTFNLPKSGVFAQVEPLNKEAINGSNALSPQTTTQAKSTVPMEEISPVLISKHPVLREVNTGREHLLLRFRYSENMPQITSEEMLKGVGDPNWIKRAQEGKESIGTVPRLTVLPCNEGCVGNPDYDKAVKRFLNSYNEPVRNGLFQYQGNMKIKVRWFNERGFFQKNAPLSLGVDVFAISFPIEGKLVTISSFAGTSSSDMKTLVDRTMSALWLQLVGAVGVGLKPLALNELLPEAEQGAYRQVADTVAPVFRAVGSLLGSKDYYSRIEPMTDGHSELLPAVDGILPNEIAPLDKVVYLNTW